MLKSQRLKLAKAARELAMECVAGTAPKFGAYRLATVTGEPCCALGWVYFRFHKRPVPPPGLIEFSTTIHDMIPIMEVLVEANNDAFEDERHAAVVFPLLAYADELESQP